MQLTLDDMRRGSPEHALWMASQRGEGLELILPASADISKFSDWIVLAEKVTVGRRVIKDRNGGAADAAIT